MLAEIGNQARLAVDAIVRTLARLLVTRRHLLQWTTAAAAQAQGIGGRQIGELVHAARVEAVAAVQLKELHRREMAYRGHTGAPEVAGRTVILIDDGIATGSTIRAAVLDRKSVV